VLDAEDKTSLEERHPQQFNTTIVSEVQCEAKNRSGEINERSTCPWSVKLSTNTYIYILYSQ